MPSSMQKLLQSFKISKNSALAHSDFANVGTCFWKHQGITRCIHCILKFSNAKVMTRGPNSEATYQREKVLLHFINQLPFVTHCGVFNFERRVSVFE